MIYRKIPKCPEPDYITGESVAKEIMRFNKTLSIIAIIALMTDLIIVGYLFFSFIFS